MGSPLLLGGPSAAPQLVVSQPLNDLQLLALVAGMLAASSDAYTAAEAVGVATDIVAEAVKGHGRLVQRIADVKFGAKQADA